MANSDKFLILYIINLPFPVLGGLALAHEMGIRPYGMAIGLIALSFLGWIISRSAYWRSRLSFGLAVTAALQLFPIIHMAIGLVLLMACSCVTKEILSNDELRDQLTLLFTSILFAFAFLLSAAITSDIRWYIKNHQSRKERTWV